MFRILVFAGMMMLGSVMAAQFADQAGQRSASTAKAQPQASQPMNAGTMVIRPDAGGHFQVEARVDGRRLDFMVDTGASQITLREQDAAMLGIHPTPSDYTVKISTANGIGRAARVELGMVEVGDIMVRNIPALIVPDEALSVNLLGMSFLSRVRWSHEGGNFILEQ
jgi:aspartyl protease family protein